MKTRLRVSLIAGAAVAVITAGMAVAGTTATPAEMLGQNDNETPIEGEALTRASAAALERVGGGIVTETEVGDEEGYYEVEVRRADGSQLDVHLDRDFVVIDQSPDEDRTGEEQR